jgi:hypothetical protein
MTTTIKQEPGRYRAEVTNQSSRPGRRKGNINRMSFKPRVALLGVLALVILSGIATSAASASNPSWKVNGTKLAAQTKEAAKITALESSELKGKVVGDATTIICTTAVAENAYIEGNGAGAGQDGAKGITFTNCTTTIVGLANCRVNVPIKTSQLKSHLVTYGEGQEKIGDLFEPSQSSGEYVALGFHSASETEKCAIPEAEKFPVKGSVVAEVKTGEAVKGELTYPTTPITKAKLEGQAIEPKLSLGGNPGAIFAGRFEVELVSGKKFGASF